MTKLSFVADVHIGNPAAFGGPVQAGINQRGREVLAALERAVEASEDSTALVICGDLFDTSSPSPQMISEVQRILSQAPKVLVLMGNHDMVSDTPGDNALGPLMPLPNVMSVEQPELYTFENTALMVVPFQAGDCREWFPQAVKQLAATPTPEGTIKVLAFHLGVIDEDTPAFLAKAHDAIELEVVKGLMEEYGISYAFCGNWHSPKKWRTSNGGIVQCGALCPTGWDNPGWDYGKVWHIKPHQALIGSTEIPGPRFLNVTSKVEAENAMGRAEQTGHRLYLTLKGEAAEDRELLEDVREWGVKARSVAEGETAREATRAAAQAVRGASTLNDALFRFISEMYLEDGVDRQRVQALAKKYLTAGGK